MKKLRGAFGVVAVVFFITMFGASSASAQVANLFANPSVETAASASMPQSWATDVWGTTKATFTYPTGGAEDGTRYVKTQVTTKGTGDAKWYPVHIPATAGQTYTFSEWYQSTVATAVTVEVLLTTGKYTYISLGAPAVSATWKQFQATFTAPANTKTLTVLHYIQAVGTLSVDNYSLTSGTVTSPFVYTLSNAGNRTVVQGASTSTTITATLTSGTTQSVAFSTTGLPSGVTASYSQTSCSPTCSTTLTLTASASAATGTVPVTVMGTSGTTTKSTSFNLTVAAQVVPPPFVYTLSSAGDRTVVQGASTSTTVTATLSSGTTQPVSFGTSGLPSGVTASFGQTSCSPTCATTLTLTASASAATGTVPVTVTGTAGTTTKSTSFNLTVAAPVVPPPFIYSLSNAGNRTVVQGASTSTTITATLTSGTTQSVAFSTTGLPSGVTASYSQTSCSPTCSTTLTLTASASAATGTVPITVTGTAGTTTKSTSFNLTVATQVVPPTGNNIIPNPSLEDPASDPNATAPTSWFTDGWGTNKVTYTYLKTGGHTGNRAVKMQITSYTDGDAKWTYNPIPVTPGDTYTFSDWYQSATTTHVVIEFTLTDNTQYYIEMRTATTTAANEWKKYQEDFVIPFNAKSVRVFHMMESVGSLVTDDYSLVKTIPAGFARPIVTLTFDNGFEDNVTTVIPLLDQFGFKVTYCFSTEYVEGVQSAMTQTQTIANHGHEVCSHSVHHDQGDLVTLTPAQLDYELGHSQAYLQQLTGQPVHNYISPFGSYNDFSLQFVKKYYRSHRTTDEGYNSKENFDQYRIIVQNMENTTTMAQYKSWVDEAIKDKAWLMLVYHRVASDPTLYDTPLADFQPQLQYLKDKGIAVETTDQALNELIPQVTP